MKANNYPEGQLRGRVQELTFKKICLVGITVNVSVDDLQVLYILSSDPHLHQFLSGSGSGFGQQVQFLSGNPPSGSSQNGPISIRTVLWVSKNFENFYPDWVMGSKGTFRGPGNHLPRSHRRLRELRPLYEIGATARRFSIRCCHMVLCSIRSISRNK